MGVSVRILLEMQISSLFLLLPVLQVQSSPFDYISDPIIGVREDSGRPVMMIQIKNGQNIKGVVGQQQLGLNWKNIDNIRLSGRAITWPTWIQFQLQEPANTKYRFRIVLKNETLLTSPYLTKGTGAIVHDVRHLIPAIPHIYRSSPAQFTVEWLMPEIWKFSEDFVLVVEHGEKSKWRQALREFSDGDKDGYIRITLDALAGPLVRIHLTDVEYNFSKSSSTIDLRHIPGFGGITQQGPSKTEQPSSVWII